MMKITYEGKVWEADITKWKNADVDAYSCIVTGSTGGSSNLQQFKIEDFSYTAAGKFTALFKSKENETLNEAYSKSDKQGVTADYSSDINSIFSDIYKQGYNFVETDSTQTDKGEYTESKNKDDSLNVAVKFDNTPSQVIYYFDRTPGKVVIKYVDQDGNEVRSQIDKTGKFGENYTSDKLSFDGYRFDTMNENSAATNGTLIRVEDNLTVIYKYIAQSTIDFSFFDEEDLNTPLKPNFDKTGDEKTSDSVNDELSTILKAIKNQGYDFKAVTTSQDNMFDENGKTITYLKEDGSVKYIFNKASGNLIVKYQDESGNEISSTSSNTEKVDTNYTTSQRDIEGYTLVNTVGSPSGSFTAGEQTITYYYTKNPVVEPPKEVENPETPVTPPDTIPEENTPATVVQISNPPKTTTMITTPPAVETASTTTLTLQNPAQASMLPQTGDAAMQTGLMGSMLLALSALAGVFGLRKRKKRLSSNQTYLKSETTKKTLSEEAKSLEVFFIELIINVFIKNKSDSELKNSSYSITIWHSHFT